MNRVLGDEKTSTSVQHVEKGDQTDGIEYVQGTMEEKKLVRKIDRHILPMVRSILPCLVSSDMSVCSPLALCSVMGHVYLELSRYVVLYCVAFGIDLTRLGR